LKATIDFGDFQGNEWQSIVGCYFDHKLNGGVGFIKTSQQIGGVREVAYQSQHNAYVSLVETQNLVLTC